jgi:hypothetical protein
MTNSRGSEPSPIHLQEKERTLAYLREVGAFLDERFSRPDPSWTEADRDRYKAIWIKYHGEFKGGGV